MIERLNTMIATRFLYKSENRYILTDLRRIYLMMIKLLFRTPLKHNILFRQPKSGINKILVINSSKK